jgi:hypothetical protein
VRALAAASLVLLSFGPPHHARRSAATMAPALERRIDADLAAANPRTVDDTLRLALDATGRRLHFGLGHRTSLAFDDTEREANCIEYAHLFAAVFERASARVHLDARAFVVHSDDARVAGEKLAGRGLGDHDWSLVVVHTGAGDRRLFVDPTLYDAGLGWDIAGSVTGDVVLP